MSLICKLCINIWVIYILSVITKNLLTQCVFKQVISNMLVNTLNKWTLSNPNLEGSEKFHSILIAQVSESLKIFALIKDKMLVHINYNSSGNANILTIMF